MSSPPSFEGCLYIVGTPIGNREDLSPRAVRILSEVAYIACENTHKAKRILEPNGVATRTIVYHEHNETRQALEIAADVASGKQVALITEAGMPGVSDPGFRVVRECRARGLQVSPVPGPTAAMTALAASGLPSDSFLFLGFLPPKKSARLRVFDQFRDAAFTLIFYESTHRIEKFLSDAVEVFGPDRCICVAREMTKIHETFHVGPASAVRGELSKGSTKGEFVVLIAKDGYALST